MIGWNREKTKQLNTTVSNAYWSRGRVAHLQTNGRMTTPRSAQSDRIAFRIATSAWMPTSNVHFFGHSSETQNKRQHAAIDSATFHRCTQMQIRSTTNRTNALNGKHLCGRILRSTNTKQASTYSCAQQRTPAREQRMTGGRGFPTCNARETDALAALVLLANDYSKTSQNCRRHCVPSWPSSVPSLEFVCGKKKNERINIGGIVSSSRSSCTRICADELLSQIRTRYLIDPKLLRARFSPLTICVVVFHYLRSAVHVAKCLCAMELLVSPSPTRVSPSPTRANTAHTCLCFFASNSYSANPFRPGASIDI